MKVGLLPMSQKLRLLLAQYAGVLSACIDICGTTNSVVCMSMCTYCNNRLIFFKKRSVLFNVLGRTDFIIDIIFQLRQEHAIHWHDDYTTTQGCHIGFFNTKFDKSGFF